MGACADGGLDWIWAGLIWGRGGTDMVETEERKLKEREAAAREQEERDARAGKGRARKHEHKPAEKKGGDGKKSGGEDLEDKTHDAGGGEKK